MEEQLGLAFESSSGLRAQFVKIGDDTLHAITEMMREITDSKWKWVFLGGWDGNCGSVHFWRMSLFIF